MKVFLAQGGIVLFGVAFFYLINKIGMTSSFEYCLIVARINHRLFGWDYAVARFGHNHEVFRIREVGGKTLVSLIWCSNYTEIERDRTYTPLTTGASDLLTSACPK